MQCQLLVRYLSKVTSYYKGIDFPETLEGYLFLSVIALASLPLSIILSIIYTTDRFHPAFDLKRIAKFPSSDYKYHTSLLFPSLLLTILQRKQPPSTQRLSSSKHTCILSFYLELSHTLIHWCLFSSTNALGLNSRQLLVEISDIPSFTRNKLASKLISASTTRVLGYLSPGFKNKPDFIADIYQKLSQLARLGWWLWYLEGKLLL